MDRRTPPGAALATGAVSADAESVYPDTLEGQVKRLEALTCQVEERFESVLDSFKPSETYRTMAGPNAVVEWLYVHKTYINGRYKAEGDPLALLSSPRAAVDEFERHFVPDAAQHTGAIIWRMRPQLREQHDPRTGKTFYCVRHRCSFGDNDDPVETYVLNFPLIKRTTSDG